ncbi:MAG: redox-regulated ATPase YchF [Chlorobiaceae bacterium]|nr:redox-regulated ATPase YchF [Chlorobiaceae bacterium]MBA4310239.1 redox-regulated ATPase YchF [Chlorobiaceae bacterium]
MQIGLIGLQNSGKTTLFNTLARTTIDESISHSIGNRTVVKIPDTRLDNLSKIFNPKKQVNATLEVVDIPGLQLSDEGRIKISSDFLTKVKNSDALIHVVRQFENDTVPHPHEEINPIKDIEFLETEFLFSDMAMIENRIEKINKELLKTKNQQLERELPLFKKLQEHIETEKPIRDMKLDENERKVLAGYQLLTLKPLVVGINFDENSKEKVDGLIKAIETRFSKNNFHIIPFFAKFEYELSQLPADEAEIFMSDFGIVESALDRILRIIYELLGLQSFFTVGEDETRAWTIKKKFTAQDAAGVIHTDFFDRFIRAETVHYEDFIKYGSFAKCKEFGAWRLEGKEYIVKDGDILTIRHN